MAITVPCQRPPLHPIDGLLLLSPFSMNAFDPLYFSCWARGAAMVAKTATLTPRRADSTTLIACHTNAAPRLYCGTGTLPRRHAATNSVPLHCTTPHQQQVQQALPRHCDALLWRVAGSRHPSWSLDRLRQRLQDHVRFFWQFEWNGVDFFRVASVDTLPLVACSSCLVVATMFIAPCCCGNHV
jgi:hypothetical protein